MTARSILATLHGRTAVGVPRWAVWAAYATSLTVLPAGLWRILGVDLRIPLMEAPTDGHRAPAWFGGEWWYVIALSLVSEALAFLAVGLVSEWGEVWPRWIPGLGGRRVPILAAVIPAGLGATFNTLLWPYSMTMISIGRRVDGATNPGVGVHGWRAVVFYGAYWPLAAWGPLLGILTVHYYRRRRAAESAGAAVPRKVGAALNTA
ncbi:hypothetical protein [Kitasatospora aureofaciens]|uniref:hypothetical protein n=1 Tax=Kitasatospora aureofaciens TaxID=1894 RepID=UPI001C46EF0C|nr:hypothetical protein [Kitasatospora aureofaciens]MBV6703093.1 hypothetical protein [Kitasatospora aureofaciens]